MMEHSFARRDVIKAAGAGLATGLLAGATAQAQTPAAAQPAGEFWTAEYTAKKGDVSLAMYRKRVGAPTAGGASMMDPQAIFDIGKRNYLALRKILWKAGILLAGESVGGTMSRTIRLEIGSGRLWLQESGKQKELVPSFPQKGGN